MGQGRLEVRPRGLHVRQAPHDQHGHLVRPADADPIAIEVGRGDVAAALERLDRTALAAARWFGAKGRTVSGVRLEDAFVLDPAGPQVLAIAALDLDDGSSQRYSFALTGRPLRLAEGGDGTWRALMTAIAEGRTVPAVRDDAGSHHGAAGPIRAALVCRPGGTSRALMTDAGSPGSLLERSLGADQSNTSVVLGERILLKAYRRLEAGLNPELELVAFLTEVADFPAVPPLVGYAEVVSATSGASTVAIAQSFVSDGTDAFEALAAELAGWLRAPGEVSVEFATEVAADLGSLTAGLHAALGDARGVPEFEPRLATRDELRAWGRTAQRQLARALEMTPGESGRVLRDLAPSIAAELTLFEALPSPPWLSRVHGDYHLGQVLIANDGYRVVDFEGEPTRRLEERRAHGSPLRDVASMLRSLDHVARSAERRATADPGGLPDRRGLDLEAWLRRAHERFLDAYRAGLREAGSPIDVDPALVRAFEIEKETYEFIYASTYLPNWLYAPTEGMRWLFESTA